MGRNFRGCTILVKFAVRNCRGISIFQEFKDSFSLYISFVWARKTPFLCYFKGRNFRWKKTFAVQPDRKIYVIRGKKLSRLHDFGKFRGKKLSRNKCFSSMILLILYILFQIMGYLLHETYFAGINFRGSLILKNFAEETFAK